MAKSDQGFTLIEVLVALSLMAVALMSTAPMFVYAMQSNASSADFGRVGAVALERMELLRGTNYARLPAGGSLTADVTGYSDATDPDFAVRWTIADNTTPAKTKTITVRVIALRRLPGARREVTLITLRGR